MRVCPFPADNRLKQGMSVEDGKHANVVSQRAISQARSDNDDRETDAPFSSELAQRSLYLSFSACSAASLAFFSASSALVRPSPPVVLGRFLTMSDEPRPPPVGLPYRADCEVSMGC